MSDEVTTQPSAPWWSRYVLPLQIVGLYLVLLGLARVALCVLYQDDFAAFGTADMAAKFLRGMRFDLAATLAVNGLPLLMLSLPFAFAAGRRWRLVWGWMCYPLFLLFALLASADLVYFEFVHRHVGPEITTIGEEAGDLWRLALGEHTLELAGIVAATVLLGLLWHRLLRARAHGALPAGIGTSVAGVILPLVLIVAGMRGTLLGRTLTPPDAFVSDGPTGAQVVLNGPSSVLHSLVQITRHVTEFYPWDEALETATSMIVAPDETRLRPDDYPIYRVTSRAPRSAGDTPPNVVVILLEGWSLTAVDCYRERSGLEPIGATPNFDALASEGLLLARLYACGQRTRNGYGAVLAGVPTIPRSPYFGRGLEQSTLTYLGGLARDEGYETHFVMGVPRGSQNRETTLRLAGFDHVAGSEDVPEGEARSPEPGKLRALDEFTLAAAHDRLSKAREPFLAVIHTDSTHEPYLRSSAEGFKRFEQPTRTGRYRTAVAYADWSLGRFFERARTADYFAHTVFVVVSDHIQRKPPGEQEPPALFHIPGFVLAPGLEPGVHDHVASQVDVISTVADLAGWQAPQATFGRSIFLNPPEAPPRGVLCGIPGLLVWVEDDGWVAHNGSARITSGAYAESADIDAIERRMLCFYQVAGSLLLEDRVAPRDDPGER